MDGWNQAERLLKRYNIKWKDITIQHGRAVDSVARQIYAPRPVDARSFAIFCHEVGHILGYDEVGSWNFAIEQARSFGLPVGEVKRAIRVYLFQNAPSLLPHFQ